VAVEIGLAGTYHQGSILRRRTPARLLDEIGGWWSRHAAEHEPRATRAGDAGESSLAITLHPATEPVTFEVPSAGTLTVTADTSSGGPGYHRVLVDGLRRMARDLSIDWTAGQPAGAGGDPTGYLDTGDAAAVDEAMLDWAQGLAADVLERADAGASIGPIGMSSAPTFRTDAFATTSLGPRDRAFFEQIVSDRAAGAALFPWWTDGPDAAFYRDRASCRMWADVHWRPPFDDAERAALTAVDRDLERQTGGRPIGRRGNSHRLSARPGRRPLRRLGHRGARVARRRDRRRRRVRVLRRLGRRPHLDLRALRRGDRGVGPGGPAGLWAA
jgi:hypothetical protein